jgi:uncharacterized protein YjbI with pentapeptide repeats
MEKEYLDNILKIYFSSYENKDFAKALAKKTSRSLFWSFLNEGMENTDFGCIDLEFNYLNNFSFKNCNFKNKKFLIVGAYTYFEKCYFENCEFNEDIFHFSEIFIECNFSNCKFESLTFSTYFFSKITRWNDVGVKIDKYLNQFFNCVYEIKCYFYQYKTCNGDEEFKSIISIFKKYHSHFDEIKEDELLNWTFYNIKNSNTIKYASDLSFSMCRFNDCNLSGIYIDSGLFTLGRCFFYNCEMIGAKIVGNFNTSHFMLAETNLKNAVLVGQIPIYSCNLEGAHIDAELFNINDDFGDLILNNASFSDKFNLDILLYSDDISGIDLEGKILADFNFEDKIMEEVNFRAADLTDVNFRNAILCYSDFTNANLEGADFSGADLRGAIFEGADLTDAIFDNAIISESMGNKKINYYYADRPKSLIFRKTTILSA